VAVAAFAAATVNCFFGGRCVLCYELL
jgi:hypothetical protein